MTNDYTRHPTKVRIFTEWTGATDPGGESLQWSLDGIDAARNYTEACWSFDTFAEALAAAPDFHRQYVTPGEAPANPGRNVTFIRWIALAARDTLTVTLPDDVDLNDVNPEDYPIVYENRTVIDSTDSGPWGHTEVEITEVAEHVDSGPCCECGDSTHTCQDCPTFDGPQ